MATFPTLQIKNMTLGYVTEAGMLEAVRDVSLEIPAKTSMGLVGESGSGKSTLAMGAMRYLASNGRLLTGGVALAGVDLYNLPLKEMRRIWGARIGVIYQNPATSLNPSIPIGKQLAEMAELHLGLSHKRAREQIEAMLTKVAMPDPGSVMQRFPHQLSGGMIQRCIIAMAMVTNPELLIMDEPTTALDVTTQAVVLDLVAGLKTEFESAILYITHDLAVVARICDRIGVMYAGEIMEIGATDQIYNKPLHPYTKRLLGCTPNFSSERDRRIMPSIPGFIPRPDQLPPGCIFAPRCSLAENECIEHKPKLSVAEQGHRTACSRWQELASGSTAQNERGKLAQPFTEQAEELLSTNRLKKHYPASTRKGKAIKAVDDVSLRVNRGHTLGIVGESGCGKTTLLRAIIGLAPLTQGQITLEKIALNPDVAQRPKSMLGQLQMVFQNPDASLNPLRTVAEAIGRPLSRLSGVKKKVVGAKVLDLLEAVNLPATFFHRLPGELSGGEKQRVAIARAFAAKPDLILLDEAVSSLDVSVQAALMNLLLDLQGKNRTSFLFISHDVAAVGYLSSWLAVMYLGRIIEWGSNRAIFIPPYHPYTEALLSAIPDIDPKARASGKRLTGRVPSAANIPAGCRFHTRCPRKLGSVCEKSDPPIQRGQEGHWLACHITLDELGVLQSQGTS